MTKLDEIYAIVWSVIPRPPSLLVYMIVWLCLVIGIIALLPRDKEWKEWILHMIAVSWGATYFYLVGIIWWYFDFNQIGPSPHAFEIALIEEYNLHLSFDVDGISLCFLLLTAFIITLCLNGSTTIYVEYKEFIIYLFLIELFLTLCFCTTNILFFYIFFECMLIPMYLIIGVLGGRIQKSKASFYFFLYTLFGSFFLLVGIFYVYEATGTFEMRVLSEAIADAGLEKNELIWLFFFIPFAVKIPMIPFHLWLPEAHVEAPTIGSVVLASLLLKLGGYGLIRFTLTLLPINCMYFQPLVTIIAVIGVIYGSLSALRQTDLKRIIAYSSIAHMNLAVLGLFSFTQQGIQGAIYLMVGHGVVSGALFFFVGTISARFHTRSVKYFSGLAQVMPLLSSVFFAFTMANISFPGTSNFTGELLVLAGIAESGNSRLFFAATGIFLSATYSLWLFNRVCFGTLKTTANGSNYADLNRTEGYIFIAFLIPMVLLGIYSGCITDLTWAPISDIVMLYTL